MTKNEPKYELTEMTMVFDGRELHRIRAVRDFGDVTAGDLGGWVQSEDNLSHDGRCWIYDEGIVCDKAKVSHDAAVRDHGQLRDQAWIFEDAVVQDHAQVYCGANACGRSVIKDNAIVRGDARIFDLGIVDGDHVVSGKARVIRKYGE